MPPPVLRPRISLPALRPWVTLSAGGPAHPPTPPLADRGSRVDEGKWQVSPATQRWVKDHDKHYPHADYDISKIRILDFVSSKYWQQRSEVAHHPESATRSGRSRD